MKPFIYLTSIISIIALAGLFVFKQPNGQPWLSINSLLPTTQVIEEKINSASYKIQQLVKSTSPEKENKVKVYRWKDSNGNWSYSDKPQTSFESEEVLLDPKDIIVLPTFVAPTVNTSPSPRKEVNDEVSPKNNLTTPSKVLDLYKDANNVQTLMDNREQKISQAIKDNSG